MFLPFISVYESSFIWGGGREVYWRDFKKKDLLDQLHNWLILGRALLAEAIRWISFLPFTTESQELGERAFVHAWVDNSSFKSSRTASLSSRFHYFLWKTRCEASPECILFHFSLHLARSSYISVIIERVLRLAAAALSLIHISEPTRHS